MKKEFCKNVYAQKVLNYYQSPETAAIWLNFCRQLTRNQRMHAQRLVVQKVFTRRYVFLTSATTTIRSSGLIQSLIQKAFSPRYLLLTNTLTCGSLLGAADYFVQKVENRWAGKRKAVDWARIMRVAAVGCMWGPMNHVWYRFLDRHVKAGSHAQKVVKKVVADFLVSPLFVFTFLTGIAALEGQPMQEPIDEFRKKFCDYLTLEVCVWPPIQAVNFWFVPPALRVFYVSCGQLIYNCFMTSIKHKNVHENDVHASNDKILFA
uniref:Mpv17-like protein 2 n=1 Tax=Acrobeloides nanus TaxID=290746 RepID=A0A914CVW9_9BILA